MKRFTSVFLLLNLLLSCSENQKLTFNDISFDPVNCDSCLPVEVNIPRAESADDIGKNINTAVSELVIEILNFAEEKQPETIEEAIGEFQSAFKELKDEFPDSPDWEATIDGEVSNEKKDLICIRINSYMFTGGAHGYGATSFLNFDAKSGKLLEHSDLFKDRKGFMALAEKEFRKQENISAASNINSSGFMFENDKFHLPENIGFTDSHIVLHYNQYEIASYAEGPKILELPLEEVKRFLNY